MVWAQVDPYLTFLERGKHDDLLGDEYIKDIYSVVGYDRKFCQVGRSSNIITNYDLDIYETAVTFLCLAHGMGLFQIINREGLDYLVLFFGLG